MISSWYALSAGFLMLSKVITDFFDQVKSRSKGYASMEYQLLDWRDEDLVRLDIKINGEEAPPLSTICHRSQAYGRGKSEFGMHAREF